MQLFAVPSLLLQERERREKREKEGDGAVCVSKDGSIMLMHKEIPRVVREIAYFLSASAFDYNFYYAIKFLISFPCIHI